MIATMMPLKRTVRVIAGQSPPSAEVSELDGSDRPFLQGNAEFGDRHPLPIHQCKTSPKLAKLGDILLSVRAPVGALSRADQDYGIGRGLCAIRPDGIHPSYLWWALQSQLDVLQSAATGSTYVAVTADQVGDLPLPVPGSGAEQRAIAEYLDTETARIDALISKKRRLIELLDERQRSLVSRTLFPESPSGGEAWPAWQLRRVCPGITVGVVVNPSSYFSDSGDPFIHGTDVRPGWIAQANLKYLSREDNLALSKSRVFAGDVVAMRVGEPGRAAVVPESLDGANCASILIFRKSQDLRPELLCAFLNSRQGRAQIEAVQYGAAQGVMNVSDALELRAPVPPQAEQDGLVRCLTKARSRFDRTSGALEQQIHLLVEHRRALITAAVTGEFSVPGAA